MSSEQLISRNVVVIPSLLDEYNKITALSAELKQFGGCFVLNNNVMPHVSLYQTSYPARNEQKIIEEVRIIAQQVARFEVTLTVFDIFWDTWMFWDAVITHPLRVIHNRLVRTLFPLREDNLLPVHQNMLEDRTVSEALKESIREAGNPLALATFRPHVTLTKCQTPQEAKKALEYLFELPSARKKLRFVADMLYVTDVAEHSTATQELASFPLRA